MDLTPSTTETHFHIHWLDIKRLDSECFNTYAEAESCAQDLVLRGEKFRIEEISNECPFRGLNT